MATAKISATPSCSALLALPTVTARVTNLCASPLPPPWSTTQLTPQLLTSKDNATLPLATPPPSMDPSTKEPLSRATARASPPPAVPTTWPSLATLRPTLASRPPAALMLRVTLHLATLATALPAPCALLAQPLPLVTLLTPPSDATATSRPAPTLASANLPPAMLPTLAPLAFAKSPIPVPAPECALSAQRRLIARTTFSTPLPLLKLERVEPMATAPTHRHARSTAIAVCPSSA